MRCCAHSGSAVSHARRCQVNKDLVASHRSPRCLSRIRPERGTGRCLSPSRPLVALEGFRRRKDPQTPSWTVKSSRLVLAARHRSSISPSVSDTFHSSPAVGSTRITIISFSATKQSGDGVDTADLTVIVGDSVTTYTTSRYQPHKSPVCIDLGQHRWSLIELLEEMI